MREKIAAGQVLCITLLILVASHGHAYSQRKVGPARFAVDLVTLKSGERLRGAFLGVDPEGGVSMAVQRDWLKATRAEMFEDVTRDEAADARAASIQLRERIQNWLAENPEPVDLRAFLESELERVDEQLSKLDDAGRDAVSSQFVLLKFPRRDAEYSFAQSPENRRVALLAWRERLDDVEIREAADLEEQLKVIGINPAVDVPDLADRLPPRSQSDDEWAARRAIVEYELAGRLDYQGIGSAVFRTDGRGEKPGLDQFLPDLLPQVLQGQLGGQLGDLFQEPGLRPRRQEKSEPDFRKAIAEAERDGRRGFRVTTVDLNLNRRVAKVETRFIAKLGPGKWQTVWSHSESGDASQARPEARQQIENDPQVAQALKLIESLGLGAGNQLGVAMNFGGATMEAQKAVDQEFFLFLDRYLKHLDQPELKLPAR